MTGARRGWVIGLTGGTGTGKSALAARLRRLGAAYYSVDVAAHALYAPGTPEYRALVARFGRAVTTGGARPAGSRAAALPAIDRSRLGAAVFGSPSALAALERIVHPPLAREAAAAVRRLASLHRVVVVEAGAILFALGLDRVSDRIVVLRAPVAIRVRRLAGSRGGTPAVIRRRLAAFAPAERSMERRAAACPHAVFVDASGPPAALGPLAVRLVAEAESGRA